MTRHLIPKFYTKVAALSETSRSKLSTKLIVTINLFFFSSHKGAQGGIGFPGLKGEPGAKVIIFFNQPEVSNSGDGNVMSKPTSVEVDFYYYCLIAIDM